MEEKEDDDPLSERALALNPEVRKCVAIMTLLDAADMHAKELGSTWRSMYIKLYESLGLTAVERKVVDSILYLTVKAKYEVSIQHPGWDQDLEEDLVKQIREYSHRVRERIRGAGRAYEKQLKKKEEERMVKKAMEELYNRKFDRKLREYQGVVVTKLETILSLKGKERRKEIIKYKNRLKKVVEEEEEEEHEEGEEDA